MEVTQQPDEPKLEAELDIEYEDAPEPVFTTGTPLTAMTTPVCMFPVDRVADTWLFCGKARKGGKSSYCAEHHALSWKSPTSKADDEREEQQNKIRWSFNPGAAQ